MRKKQDKMQLTLGLEQVTALIMKSPSKLQSLKAWKLVKLMAQTAKRHHQNQEIGVLSIPLTIKSKFHMTAEMMRLN